MKNFLTLGKEITKSEQKNIFGGGNDEEPEAFCVRVLNSMDCGSDVPYYWESTGSCCDRPSPL